MNEALTLSWSRAQAADRARLYRRILGINLGINVALGLFAVVAPASLANLLGQLPPGPEAAAWLRRWGIALIFMAALYTTGWLRPTTARIPNLVGLVERAVTGIACLLLGSGLVLIGLYALAFALLLAWTYYRLFQAELATRP